MLDYHLHVWPHGGERATPLRLEQIEAYCNAAAARGVAEIAITEHLNRFHQAAPLDGFWDDDANEHLRAAKAASWRSHAAVDLDDYVATLQEAQRSGLPVKIGMEVDYYAGRMDKVAAILEGYPFDVLLGSVHWIGAWGFDMLDTEVMAAEWDHRSADEAWRQYTEALEELAASQVCDVLAHPDLLKLTGHAAAAPAELQDRMAEAAATSGMAAEVSSAGWRRPVNEAYPSPDLLARFRAAGVPITLASDAHTVELVADRTDDLRELARSTGYSTVTSFTARVATQVPFETAAA